MYLWYCADVSVLVLLTCVLINSVAADQNDNTCVGDDIKVCYKLKIYILSHGC